MPQGTTWPAGTDALAIHARLCADDPVAPADLANAYLDDLTNWLITTHPQVDPHLCCQAAEDAILSLIKNPHSFKPDKSQLDTYLRMSARADLRNALGRERRHSKRREKLEVVELASSGRNPHQEEGDPALVVEREEEGREALARAVSLDIEQGFTREEQRVFELMLKGERRTDAFARALAIADLPERHQRKEVKRIKDRIKRRIQRARGRR
jgi:RNA polymerase sigma-70 factor (ECF subfamily)